MILPEKKYFKKAQQINFRKHRAYMKISRGIYIKSRIKGKEIQNRHIKE